jgi:hypothetical protein
MDDATVLSLKKRNLNTSKLKVRFTEKRYINTLIFVVSLFMLWSIAIMMGNVLKFQSLVMWLFFFLLIVQVFIELQ